MIITNPLIYRYVHKRFQFNTKRKMNKYICAYYPNDRWSLSKNGTAITIDPSNTIVLRDVSLSDTYEIINCNLNTKIDVVVHTKYPLPIINFENKGAGISCIVMAENDTPNLYYDNVPLWDVRGLTDTSQMFQSCELFNQPLNSWDVSNVTNMDWMFNRCRLFNKPLAAWNVSKVTSMKGMFKECTNFNQSLRYWDVSNVTDMRWMFAYCDMLSPSTEYWNISKYTDIRHMFDL